MSKLDSASSDSSRSLYAARFEVCIQRDVKGHYQKAIKGEIENFTGISDPYEPPLSPEVILESHLESPRQGVDHILRMLADLRYLPANSP